MYSVGTEIKCKYWNLKINTLFFIALSLMPLYSNLAIVKQINPPCCLLYQQDFLLLLCDTAIGLQAQFAHLKFPLIMLLISPEME